MKEHIWIPSRGLRLSAMLHQPAEVRRDTPLIICCHGFTGDKVGANQLTLNLTKKLAQAGYNALRFDFLGSGDSEVNLLPIRSSAAGKPISAMWSPG